jgi:DNA modification methylase
LISFLQGDVFDKLKELEDNSIDCVVTSPPYWGLRDYGTAKWQGGDLNCSHSYGRNTRGGLTQFQKNNKGSFGDEAIKSGEHCKLCGAKRTPVQDGIKEKDLVMIPNRIAIALQDAGWYIRSEIIWHKPNPMPESVRDRPTSCHEKIWLITKSKKYYYDADAIKEPVAQGTIDRLSQKNLKNQIGSKRGNGGKKPNGNMKAVGTLETKNKRNVWTVTTKPCKDAHFATFPKDLIDPCIKAGCPEGGVVLDPFGGSGTTAIVAKLLNRKSIIIELNSEYVKIAKNRISKEFGIFE